MTLTQEEFIDGLVGVWSEELPAADYANYNPDAPVPKGEWLSLHDEVGDEETKEISDKEYKAVCGRLIWVSSFAHKEISQGISVAYQSIDEQAISQSVEAYYADGGVAQRP